MSSPKLFMLLLGWRVKGRYTEQHDIYFGIGESLKDIVPGIVQFLPHSATTVHVDVWREVNYADDYLITIKENELPGNTATLQQTQHLFFLNLGGYKENEFEEAHYKMLVVADSIDNAKRKAKHSFFFKNTSLTNSSTVHSAGTHIDDKYGVDVDDVAAVKDILLPELTKKYSIRLQADNSNKRDDFYTGYLRIGDI